MSDCLSVRLSVCLLPACLSLSVCPSFCLSICMEQLGSHWMDFHETWYLSIFRNSVEKTQGSLKFDKNKLLYMKTFLHLWQYVSEFFLEWEMLPTNGVEKIKTQFMFKNFFSPENLAICEIMRENMRGPDRPQAIIRRMCIAYCITEATHTHTKYDILIAFGFDLCLTVRLQCRQCNKIKNN
jgi:hypothetical protein